MTGPSADDEGCRPRSSDPGGGIPADLAAALDALAATPRLLVALDFDGVLAPLGDDAHAVRPLPASLEAVARLLDAPDTWVGLVSGRSLESLDAVSEADPRMLAIGSHGVEVRLAPGQGTVELTDDERRRLDELAGELDRIAERAPGAVVEHKPAGLGLHTRRADDADTRLAWEAAKGAAEHLGGFVVRGGKDILEFAVREATKGDAVERLREETAATGSLFAGDDTTDEDGFRALRTAEGDVGVKVGGGETAARFRVGSPEDVAAVLARLAERRAGPR